MPSQKFGTSKDGEIVVCEKLFGSYPLWKEEHCVPGSKMLPSGQYTSDDTSGIVVFFKAKGRNSLSICLSPEQSVASSGVYEILIGSMNNQKTCIKRANQEVASIPHSNFKLCNSIEFLELYIAFVNNILLVGVGKTIGENIILKYLEVDFRYPTRYVSFSSWNATNRYTGVFIKSPKEMNLVEVNLKESEKYLDFSQYKQTITTESVTETELEQRRQRKHRFKTNVEVEGNNLTNEEIVNKLFVLMESLEIKRKDLYTGEQLRKEAVYVFGNFDGKFTDDIFNWFESFTSTGKIDWLHDYGLNFLFKTNETMNKAFLELTKELPESLDKEKQSELIKMKTSRWRYAIKWDKIFLLRPSSVSDVKKREDKKYRKHENFPGDDRKKRSKIVAKENKMEDS